MSYSLEKIAKEFGISKSAVSLIVNGKAFENRISSELEQKVLTFCDEVNYSPNIHARRMCSKIVRNVGLFISENMLVDNENPFSDQIISEITGGAVLAAARRNFRVTIQLYNKTMNAESIFEWLRNREVDGLVYYGYSFDNDWMRSFLAEKRSVVCIGVEPLDGVTTVNLENRKIMSELTENLIKKGRKKFIYLSCEGNYVSNQRLLGVCDVLNKYSVAFDKSNIINADFSEKRAYNAILNCEKDFDAVICANDNMALGALRALKEKNIGVPDDVSVTGADNIMAVSYAYPAIATIDNMNTELGKTAFEELYRLINGKEPRKIEIQSKFIKNNSI